MMPPEKFDIINRVFNAAALCEQLHSTGGKARRNSRSTNR